MHAMFCKFFSVSAVQKLSKSVKISHSYSQKYNVTFLWFTVYMYSLDVVSALSNIFTVDICRKIALIAYFTESA